MQAKNGVMPARQMSLEESLNILMSGFLKNGKANREVRVGITHVMDFPPEVFTRIRLLAL